MKKIALLLAVPATFILASCNGGSTTNLKTNTDSATYAIGLSTAQRLISQIDMAKEQGDNIDTEAFMKGLKDGMADTTKYSYYAGTITGVNMGRELIGKQKLNKEVFLGVFEQVFKKDTANYKMSDSLAQVIAQEYFVNLQKREMEEKFGANREKGAEFIEKFKQENPEAKTTESGLVYIVEKEGSGDASPVDTDFVKVNYRGTLIDGTEFDKSGEEPTQFVANGVIKGWTEMLKLMKKGEKVKVVIPQELAYGENGTYSIDPYSTLVFEIELVDFSAKDMDKN